MSTIDESRYQELLQLIETQNKLIQSLVYDVEKLKKKFARQDIAYYQSCVLQQCPVKTRRREITREDYENIIKMYPDSDSDTLEVSNNVPETKLNVCDAASFDLFS